MAETPSGTYLRVSWLGASALAVASEIILRTCMGRRLSLSSRIGLPGLQALKFRMDWDSIESGLAVPKFSLIHRVGTPLSFSF
jgi:hypothetical protein